MKIKKLRAEPDVIFKANIKQKSTRKNSYLKEAYSNVFDLDF